ncbi:MAG: SAM-dependent DNA methyltransferase [Bryobacterales bacterium]|nr:SAM-dependent DNA methyltransferase [Bryobacterales bacterium]
MSNPAIRRLGDEYEKTLDPAARRRAGAYYTPGFIARFIVRETLGWLLGPQPGSTEILQLRILDPALGAGHFLTAALHYLIGAYHQACRRERILPEPEAARMLAGRCLYGVDVDPVAVALARRSVAHIAGMEEHSLAGRLVSADALSDDFDWAARFPEVFPAPGRGFSAIIGNPPFLRERDYRECFAQARHSQLGRRWATGKMDYWYFFAHRSLELLAADGVHSFIAPAYWPRSHSAHRLSAHIRQKHYISLWIDLGLNRVFEAASTRLAIYMLKPVPGSGHPRSHCVLFEPRLGRDQLRDGLDRLPEATPGVTRIVRRPWSRVAAGPFLELGVDPLSAPGAARREEATLEELGFLVTQGIAQNPARVTTRNLGAAALHYGLTPDDLLHLHQVSVGEGVFVLRRAELERLGLPATERALFEPYFDARQLCCRSGLPPATQWLLYAAPETSTHIQASAPLMRHLARFRFLMELRRETQSGARPWWQMHWPRRRCWFRGPRLIVPQLSARPSFIYADTPGFVNLSVNVIVCPGPLTAKLLWILLNGPRVRQHLLASAKRRGAGVDLGVACLRHIPLPRAPFSAGSSGSPEIARRVIEAFDTVRKLEAEGPAAAAVDAVLAEAAQAVMRG